MTDRPINMPFERVPQCACDPGRGEPPSRLKIMECKAAGGPCRPDKRTERPITREELIAALEKATGPSRELDGRIFMLLTGGPTNCAIETRDGRVVVDEHVPRYTSSIDAALTLVPEGWCWNVGINLGGAVWGAGPSALVFEGRIGLGRSHGALQAATPALALTIAALKAGKP